MRNFSLLFLDQNDSVLSDRKILIMIIMLVQINIIKLLAILNIL